MIDTKYGLKYSMPHSLVHIVDNSMYTGELPIVVADDPSLYGTIVVTGAPMGVDNKVVKLTRSDVLNVAFGIQNLSASEREKYGQTIEYAGSLIKQGALVRFMRVTPEGSTYGLTCIAVLWRIAEDNVMHVRFEEMPFPVDMQLDKFANGTRLNAALVKQFNTDNVESGGYNDWHRRVFMTYVSAGRGSVYNYMANAINTTSQTKRPANVKYEFVTIDTRTNVVCERFYASLVNVNNVNRADAIDPVNVVINKRVEGSSIITPFLNESAVHEVYNAYMTHFKEMIDSTVTDEFTKNAYVAMNVNIFDMIYGNYIYNGSDSGYKLPFYQVDMYNTEIPSLPTTNHIVCNETTYNADNKNTPAVLCDQLKPLMYGIIRDNDTTYVGDIYLSTIGTTNLNPTMTIVGVINQYTGAVTSLTIPKVYPLTVVDGVGTVMKTVDDVAVTPVQITAVFNDTVSESGLNSKVLNTLVDKKTLKAGCVVAQVMTTGKFNLYTVSAVDTAASGDKYTLVAYTQQQVYQALAWQSHSSGASGAGNIIGYDSTCTAYTTIGATVIDADGNVYVNDYSYNKEEDTGRIAVTNNTLKFGKCPTDVNITTDIVGAEYDVIVYPDDSASKWTINNVAIASGGTGYAVGDLVRVTTTSEDGTTTLATNGVFTVTSVDVDGAVTGLAVSETAVLETTNFVSALALETTYADQENVGSGTGLTVTITEADVTVTEYSGVPTEITRYVVSGVQGSLFRVANDTSVDVPHNYYADDYGLNLSSEVGGVRISMGSTGFFDDETMNPIEFKWRYSALLVKAYRGELDPRIMSPTRVPAKFLFDGGHNTIVGQTIQPYIKYTPTDIINASTIFTADEKEEVMFTPDVIANITDFEDIDVKQAMYDLMVYRCYQGIPEDKRPIGPGSGLSLHLDSGITDANTAMLINTSFSKRFDNPNASWDIGGWVDISTGMSYTYTKRLVDNLVSHCKRYSINKPFVGKYSMISNTEYSSFFPDVDTTDWELRELLYKSGGNAWIADINGNLTRRSQRTLLRDEETSDLVQESNMRTLSQLVYLLQNKIDEYLLEYNDDGVLKTLSDEVNNMFSNWVGTLVDGLDITFERDINIDGGEILVCYCNVTFRGLILRVPIIVNVNRRDS